MRSWIWAFLAGALASGGPAAAEVMSRSDDGFTLRFAAGLETTPERVIQSVSEIPRWWDPAHTYTGDAANLSLAFQTGGCWCETLADGTRFEHAQVRSIDAGRVLLSAPLGPLNGKATRADLTFSVGPGTRERPVSMDFVVEGPGVGAFAQAVDGVMAQAWDRFVRQIEDGGPLAP